ncbi:MAG: hypothetical protein L0191_20780 [Acidobacteria bacterium]|nr:hypothetical protein [Acidobacteriota bacterium]
MTSRIERCIMAFHNRLSGDRHHRFRSWGHCYRYFRQARAGRVALDLDHASLQLGFYLASWGMYRGASFLLWKDYRLHRYAVQDLFRVTYRSLWNLDYARIRDENRTADLVLDLADRLHHTYKDHVLAVNGTKRRVEATDTLVTKILLGTLACTPAYDEFVQNGLYADGISYSYLNRRHILALWRFCNEHDREFRRVQRRIRENRIRYPAMKLVDMYFWIRGQRAAARWESR